MDFIANTLSSGVSTTSGAGNLIGYDSGFQGSIASRSNPQLGMLGDFGGPTKTFAITSLSPAFNQGEDSFAAGIFSDQRGTDFSRRMFGRVDVGALRLAPSLLFQIQTYWRTCLQAPRLVN